MVDEADRQKDSQRQTARQTVKTDSQKDVKIVELTIGSEYC